MWEHLGTVDESVIKLFTKCKEDNQFLQWPLICPFTEFRYTQKFAVWIFSNQCHAKREERCFRLEMVNASRVLACSFERIFWIRQKSCKLAKAPSFRVYLTYKIFKWIFLFYDSTLLCLVSNSICYIQSGELQNSEILLYFYSVQMLALW